MSLKSLIVLGLWLGLNNVHAQPQTAETVFPFWSAEPASRLMTGDCRVCPLLPQSKWYFTGEWLSISNETLDADDAVPLPEWLNNVSFIDSPPPVWLGKPESLNNVTIDRTNGQLRWPDGKRQSWQIIKKIPQNQSYWNADSAAFFADKALFMRGESFQETFVAETVWPLAFAIGNMHYQPLGDDETFEEWIRADQGGRSQPHTERLIWQRQESSAENAAGKPVLAIMLNGAQGDDDEALAGHFALVTGEFNANGSYHNWLVNNFYSLDVVSEKGIIAAVTPMDKYLADLNSGQNYYRPSYMLVATLNDNAPVRQIQQSMNQIMQQFYRHSFQYQHAAMNCTGISIDALKALGWQVPERGNSGIFMAMGAYFYSLLTEADFNQARQLYDYLMTETTRLLPAQAFDALSHDLLRIAEQRSERELNEFEQRLADNIDALWLVRIPQIPSDRALGDAPVFSFQEYIDTAPADRDDWISIELPAQQLPKSLQSKQPVNAEPLVVPWPVILILLSFVWLLYAVLYYHRRLFKR